MTDRTFHRVLRVQFEGGFMDGVALDLANNLNCVIGGRGTGKTTVLEAVRFALDRMPDPRADKGRKKQIEGLLDHALQGGAVSVTIETQDGIRYIVSRGLGEKPEVVDDHGDVKQIDVSRDLVFGVDVYSQNEIEDIAENPRFQLQLIDRFVSTKIDEVEHRIREVLQLLQRNADEVLRERQKIADLSEAIRELPDIAERLRGLVLAEDPGSELQQERENSALRARELQLARDIESLYEGVRVGLAAVDTLAASRDFQREAAALSASPNAALVAELADSASTTLKSIRDRISEVQSLVGGGDSQLASMLDTLSQRHDDQTAAYQARINEQEQDLERQNERKRLQLRHDDLARKETQQREAREHLSKLDEVRAGLHARLSELRDERFGYRASVAAMLNERLSPMIQVGIEQFGNPEEYKAVLASALKGSGLRYAAIVDRIAQRLPPAEFASLVAHDDIDRLCKELDVEEDRATRIVIQLRDTPELFAIETADLLDQPTIKLRDGDRYKESSALSTGQRCTTILPILLLESERPLLIDQPEDNLDNAFVFETIVPSIRRMRNQRQLILATHNPNIPVLGDAERVFALHSTGRRSAISRAGAVDEVANEIMTILEGGRAAFEARRERYGQPVPEPGSE